MTQPFRTTFLDYDARRDPKTNRFCIKCQKDLKPGGSYHAVHIVGGGASILHPADEDLYVDDGGDMNFFEVGNDCARQIGLEWCWPKGTLATPEPAAYGWPNVLEARTPQ